MAPFPQLPNVNVNMVIKGSKELSFQVQGEMEILVFLF